LKLRSVAFAADMVVIVLLLAGCASKSFDAASGRPVTISTSFKQLGIGANITRIVLDITGSGFSPMSQELSIANGLVRADVDVPFGTARIFELTAFGGETVLYQGADTVDVSTSSVTEVSIYMRPQVPMIKINPLYGARSMEVQNGEFSVEVFNVDSLFGIAFRLEVDSTVIQFTGAEAGGFLGGADSTLFFAQMYPHYLPVGYTLRGNQQPMGLSGSGKIARVTYTAKKAGTSPVTINPSYVKLIDWQGRTLPRQGQIYIESGEVEILAQ
jgi:hypothetical protein